MARSGAIRSLDERKRARRGLARAFASSEFRQVECDAFAELARHFTPRQITDISLSATYYRALGTLVMAFGVEMESPAVMKIEKDWQKAKAGL